MGSLRQVQSDPPFPGNELLFCDGCDAAWHLHCLRPKLLVVPVDDWYCPTCAAARREEAKMEEVNSIEKVLDERTRKLPEEPAAGAASSASIAAAQPLQAETAQERAIAAAMAFNNKMVAVAESKSPNRSRKVIEYLCKYRGRAHIHAAWLTQAEIAQDGRLSLQRLQHYEKKKGQGELDVYKPECTQVERVLACADAPPSQGKRRRSVVESDEDEEEEEDDDDDGFDPNAMYLVKWCSLTYDQSTWEYGKDIGKECVLAWRQREEKVIERLTAPPPEQPAASKQSSKGRGKKAAGVPTVDASLPEGFFPSGRMLRDYQLDGLHWLRHNYVQGRSVILGDEMGLGKTAQSVTMLQCVRHIHHARGPMLIVVL